MLKPVLLALFLGLLIACGTASKPEVDTLLPPASTESIEGVCLDWQLDSVNSELAWAGYRAGLRPAPRSATPQEVASCRELGYLTQQEHCDAWYRYGIRPPLIGSSASRRTIDRSCQEYNGNIRVPTVAPSPSRSALNRLSLSTATRPPQWYETGELCEGPGLLPSFETNIGPGGGVPYRLTLMDVDHRAGSVHVVLRFRVEHLPDFDNLALMHQRGQVPKFALEIPYDLLFDRRGMLRWGPAITIGSRNPSWDGIGPEHALWYPDCKGPREIVTWDRYPTFKQGGSGIFEWSFTYPVEAQNLDLNLRVGTPSLVTAFTLNLNQLTATPTSAPTPAPADTLTPTSMPTVTPMPTATPMPVARLHPLRIYQRWALSRGAAADRPRPGGSTAATVGLRLRASHRLAEDAPAGLEAPVLPTLRDFHTGAVRNEKRQGPT